MSLSTIYVQGSGRANERLLEIAGWVYKVRRPYVIARKHRLDNEQILADARAAAVREGVAL